MLKKEMMVKYVVTDTLMNKPSSAN